MSDALATRRSLSVMSVTALRIVAVSIVALPVVALSTTAFAQQDHLRAAEEAYSQIEFEQTLAEAQLALEEGDHSPEELARIYELIGMTAAANEEEERSSAAYVRLLALRPEAQMDTNLAPRLRSPFLEAKGYWASRTARLSAEVRLIERRSALRVELVDPVGMGTDVIMRTREAGTNGEWEEYRDVARASFLVTLEFMPPQIEYILEVVDEHGNQVIVLGSEDEPRVLGESAGTAGGGSDDRRRGVGGVPIWVWVVAGVAVAGAAATGLYLGLRTRPITLQSAVLLE